MRPIVAYDLGSIAYDEAYAIQCRTVKALQNESGDEAFFLLEHPHVITRGRNASTDAVQASASGLYSRGVALTETDRGGDVTYHGPGQLVGYPIIRLLKGRRDVRRYVSDIEDVVIRTLSDFSIEGTRHPVHRGVWVSGRKIASVGIRIARWVTSHGFALNVTTDLSYFQLIHPCGIEGCEMTSIEQETGSAVDMTTVKHRVAHHFADVFDRAVEFGKMQEFTSNV